MEGGILFNTDIHFRNGFGELMNVKKSDVGPLPTPERAVYGFVLFVLTIVTFLVYCLWVFVPFEVLDSIGLSYWPAKHWAITGPVAVLVATIIAVFLIYPLISISQCASKDNEESLFTDSFAVSLRDLSSDELELNPVFDYDISQVNKLLYSR